MAVTDQPNMPSEVNTKIGSSFSFGVILLLLALVGVLVFSFLNNWQKGSIVAETAALDQQITNLKAEMAGLKEQKVDVSKNAVDALVQIKSQEIRWSDIILAVSSLVPKTSEGRPKINFLSYSGSADGKLNLSAATNPAAEPPYADVAQLISVFNNNVYFQDAFVPSISVGKDQTGLTALTFVFNVNYQEPTLEDLNLAPSEPVAPTPVPRNQ